MIAVTVRDNTGKEYRMVRDVDNSYYFIRNILLCNNPDVIVKEDSNKKVKEFLEFWDTFAANTRMKSCAGLYPIERGLIVVDLIKNLVFICFEESSDPFSRLALKGIINSFKELGNCKQYKWMIPELLKMKDDIKKLGFIISKEEEKEWDSFLNEFKGHHHIKVENV